ncbi:LipA and NB-ARC domain protein [Aspergillus tanneri]|uniref:DUF676 domain-containing protein n=1 Tax=Aspergillus tanneri TaxID=1220188 RepID=A0A5M9M2U2_9EURO|nr:uncharacterized protein ATNIH1004_002035 [Aspergillus tanneri]KAA8641295.1 hypothetical protein ATNIH1004_002035 [Aspergillus tanneri]
MSRASIMNIGEHEYPFLEEVFTPAEQPKIDFVFVHGLNPRGRNDHPFETWTHQNGTFWPRDLLPHDIPQARIFIYGYNSNITNPQTMSTAGVKDHANTLLNLLDMERSPQLNVRLPKIIFIGHSLGGLVIKQALLNAQEDPKYTAIRTGTSGLVFFGCPHHGTKGVELGKIAAKVARFVSKGHASNDLLDCLEHNSLFTRQMSVRFSHQLEDYKVVSFIEGKEVLLGGSGPASISHLVVDEESAVLGLPGQRETRLKLDADHSQMCKVGSRGPMYKLIKGNIKQIADSVLVAEQGYIPQPSTTSRLPPPSIASTDCPTSHRNAFVAVDNDPRSMQAAEQKNNWQWDKARDIEYAIFQEHLRTLGPDHHSTLLVGYNLAEIDLRSEYLNKATEWCEWVSNNTQRVFDRRHPLAMKAESLMGEILCHKGKYQEGESVCANVLARQQMTIGEDDLDTLETRRRLAEAYGCLGRREEGVAAAEKRAARLQHLLGENHIQALAAVLCTAELVVSNHTQTEVERAAARFNPQTQTAVDEISKVSRELHNLLGPRHPLTIWGYASSAPVRCRPAPASPSPSETLRRALASAEEYLGADHPETMNIVAHMGMMYAMQGGMARFSYGASGSNAEIAVPWLQRYLTWAEHRLGRGHPDVQGTLSMLAMMYMTRQQYPQAQGYFDRLLASYDESGTELPENVRTMAELCRMNTRFLEPQRGSSLQGLLKSFQRQI